MITIIEAIFALKPGVKCVLYDADSIDNFTAVWGSAEDEIERDVIIKKYNDMQAEFTANQYQRDRQAEYPDWGTQLNKIYDDGLTKWKSEMVDPIKAKYPKP